MYQLFFKKDETYSKNCIYQLEIKPLQKIFNNMISDVSDKPYKYNDCYYFCSDRKQLVELANGMKQQWINELETKFNLVKNIEVK